MYDLKSTADILWVDANEPNLKKFSNQLKNTMDEVEKSFLFIEDNNFQQLEILWTEFNKYDLGKTKIIQLYKLRRGTSVDLNEIHQWINQNGAIKQNYEHLIDEIRRDLKIQIRGGR